MRQESPDADCPVEWIDDGEALCLLAGARGALASWRQFPAYAAQAASRVGACSRYALVRRGGAPLALANLRTRAVPLLGATTLASHGPVLLAAEPAGRVRDLPVALEALRRFARANGLGELRIDPDPAWTMDGTDAGLDLASGFRREARARAYRTIVLDLNADTATIRSRMDGKWRRDLQRGEREALAVSRSHAPEDFLRLAPLLDDLSRAKGFGVAQGCAFFARCAAAARAPERFFVHLVHRDDEIVSGHIGAFSGNMAVYLLGATSPAGRELRASYVAQWAAIESARELGMAYYDLGGIDPDANPEVHRFKKRMGGAELVSHGEMRADAPGWRGTLLFRLRALYQALRR